VISVGMLSEGWDARTVTHIMGLRAFTSQLLCEQVVGRGLRRTNYDVLNQPFDERPEGSEETVDAFGIPFVGFPVEKRKRPKTGEWGQRPVWIEPDAKKAKYRVQVPNVRSWAVGVTESLADLIRVEDLPQIRINPKDTPPDVRMRPVVGGAPETVMHLEEFRAEWPTLRSAFRIAEELYQQTNPGSADELNIGPTFEELVEVTQRYVARRVVTMEVDGQRSDARDIGIPFWRGPAMDVLENAIRGHTPGVEAVPILGSPEWLDSANLRRFQWTGIVAEGKRCHTNKVPCHTDLEKRFADFLDGARDVVRYFKNERLGFSVTYYESNRPRQYYPDFVIAGCDQDGREVMWLAETKGEIRPNTAQERGGPTVVREDERDQVRAVAVPVRTAAKAGGRAGGERPDAGGPLRCPGSRARRAPDEPDLDRGRTREAGGVQVPASHLHAQGRSRVLRERRGCGAGRMGRGRRRRADRREDVRVPGCRPVDGADHPRWGLPRFPRQTCRHAAGKDCPRAVSRTRGPRYRRRVHGEALLIGEGGRRPGRLATYQGHAVANQPGVFADHPVRARRGIRADSG